MTFLNGPFRNAVSVFRRSTSVSPRPFERWLASALLGLSLCLSGPVAADDEFTAIRATVFDYFEGINELSLDHLQRAFDANAALKSVDASGTLVVEPIADAIDRWMQSDAVQRRGKILSIDLSGGPIALVVFDYDGAYVDFLTLARLQGQWKIIDKVFVRAE
ncbi:MAG: hypothetical protein ACI8RN_003120 [Glaciecola sp.]|jgi:hypothetical protein|uniref:nuclear transport factor 2 family protein n=1 Tax=Congregibacter sp. TaxID=2744308 RepID=UPI0039E60B54